MFCTVLYLIIDFMLLYMYLVRNKEYVCMYIDYWGETQGPVSYVAAASARAVHCYDVEVFP